MAEQMVPPTQEVFDSLLKLIADSQPIHDTRLLHSAIHSILMDFQFMARDSAIQKQLLSHLERKYMAQMKQQTERSLADKLRRVPLAEKTIGEGYEKLVMKPERSVFNYPDFLDGVRFAEEQHGITQDLTPGGDHGE